MASGDYFLNIKNLTSIGMADLNSDETVPQMAPGAISFCHDAFGYRVLQYVRVFATVAQGGCVSKWGDVSGTTAVTGITSGTVTTAVKAASWTANTQNGAIFYVTDDAGAAGAAPEGEISIVATTAAGQLTLEPELPMSAAIAVNDAVRTISTWQAEASADGDLAQTCLGIVIGKNGITSGNYGWVVSQGFTKATTAVSVVVNEPVVCAAGTVGPWGTDGQELQIGTAKGAVAADQVALKVPVLMMVFPGSSVAIAP